jgi:DNA-binding winged helix-turn-helix (wHTH) protein
MRREGNVLSADEIMAALWPGETGVDHSERLKDVLKSLRRLLGADAACIQNVRGQGYFFRRLG